MLRAVRGEALQGPGFPHVVSSEGSDLTSKLTRDNRIKEVLQNRVRGKVCFGNDKIVPGLLKGNKIEPIIIGGELHPDTDIRLRLGNQACDVKVR